MIDKDTFVTRGMERIHQAIVDAPSHLELEAGFEALLHHLVAPDEEEQPDEDGVTAAKTDAQTGAAPEPAADEAQTAETMKAAEDVAQETPPAPAAPAATT